MPTTFPALSFQSYLHNGDPLGVPTVNHPAGKLFYDFETAALDAFHDKQILINQYTSEKYIEVPNGTNGTKSTCEPNTVDEQIGVYLLLDSLLN
jgi:hypothetical protein